MTRSRPTTRSFTCPDQADARRIAANHVDFVDASTDKRTTISNHHDFVCVFDGKAPITWPLRSVTWIEITPWPPRLRLGYSEKSVRLPKPFSVKVKIGCSVLGIIKDTTWPSCRDEQYGLPQQYDPWNARFLHGNVRPYHDTKSMTSLEPSVISTPIKLSLSLRLIARIPETSGREKADNAVFFTALRSCEEDIFVIIVSVDR